MIKINPKNYLGSRVTFRVETDVQKAQYILALLYAWEIDVLEADVDNELDIDPLSLVGEAMRNLAWHIWGDEGIFNDNFWKLTEDWSEGQRRNMWNLRHLAYRNVPDYDNVAKEL